MFDPKSSNRLQTFHRNIDLHVVSGSVPGQKNGHFFCTARASSEQSFLGPFPIRSGVRAQKEPEYGGRGNGQATRVNGQATRVV